MNNALPIYSPLLSSRNGHVACPVTQIPSFVYFRPRPGLFFTDPINDLRAIICGLESTTGSIIDNAEAQTHLHDIVPIRMGEIDVSGGCFADYLRGSSIFDGLRSLPVAPEIASDQRGPQPDITVLDKVVLFHNIQFQFF